jgi:hypothetical protein
MEAYNQLNALCDTDPTTDWLSTNMKLRHLRGHVYNVQNAFTSLVLAEEQRAFYDADQITYEDISTCINWGLYARLGSDPSGRAIVYVRFRNAMMG